MARIHVRVVSLDRYPERWARFNSSIREGFASFVRYSAFNGYGVRDLLERRDASEHTKLKILGSARRSHEEIDSLGSFGCSQSHLGVLSDFTKSSSLESSDLLLVLEDDVNLEGYEQPGDFYRYVTSQLAALPIGPTLSNSTFGETSGWDLFLLGSTRIRDASPWDQPAPTPSISSVILNPEGSVPLGEPGRALDVRSFFGTFSYVVNRRAAKLLVRNGYPIEAQIDAYMGSQAQLGQIRIIANPGGARGYLDLGDNIPHRNQLACSLNSRTLTYKILFWITVILLVAVLLLKKKFPHPLNVGPSNLSPIPGSFFRGLPGSRGFASPGS